MPRSSNSPDPAAPYEAPFTAAPDDAPGPRCPIVPRATRARPSIRAVFMNLDQPTAAPPSPDPGPSSGFAFASPFPCALAGIRRNPALDRMYHAPRTAQRTPRPTSDR